MVDLVSLSVSAIVAAAQHLGQKAAEGAAGLAGAKIVDWLKEKFTGPTEKTAIEALTANPDSAGARRTMEGIVLSRLEQDPALVQNLSSLLNKPSGPTILNQTVSGDHNTVVQSTGHQSPVTISNEK